MITDKEKEDARLFFKKVLMVIEPFTDEPALTMLCNEIERNRKESAEQARKEERATIMSEIANGGKSCHWCIEENRRIGADQARKEAAERAACVWLEHGEDITLRIIHDAILSTVNESFTVAHVSTDAEKLAIAVKALESASIGLALYDGDYGTLSLVRQALKEIQG